MVPWLFLCVALSRDTHNFFWRCSFWQGLLYWISLLIPSCHQIKVIPFLHFWVLPEQNEAQSTRILRKETKFFTRLRQSLLLSASSIQILAVVIFILFCAILLIVNIYSYKGNNIVRHDTLHDAPSRWHDSSYNPSRRHPHPHKPLQWQGVSDLPQSQNYFISEPSNWECHWPGPVD